MSFRRIQLGPVFITNRQLLSLRGGLLLMVALHVLVTYTKFGKAMRAVGPGQRGSPVDGDQR